MYDAQLVELTRHAFRLFLFAGFSILAFSFFTALDNGLILAAILFFADACVPGIVGYPAAADFFRVRHQTCRHRAHHGIQNEHLAYQTEPIAPRLWFFLKHRSHISHPNQPFSAFYPAFLCADTKCRFFVYDTGTKS